MKARRRCTWCGTTPIYVAYHDEEWGVPVRDDDALFEKLVLDGFQAGLSWITILKKRDNFRAAFSGFDAEAIARYGQRDVERLMRDPGIVRNRAKIEATITNAKAYLALKEPFGDLLWDCVGGAPIDNRLRVQSAIAAQSPESAVMAKALKKLGFRFCGPTICYAFMQAVGMVNDHLVSCFRHAEVGRAAG